MASTTPSPHCPALSNNTLKAPRTCFICFSNEDEEPGRGFCSACPCALEAHEACMLRWVAQMEAQGDVPRCSACRAPIKIQQPLDAFVAVNEALAGTLKRVAPFFVGGLFVAGGVISSASYGVVALSVFADQETAACFLLLPPFDRYRDLGDWKQGLRLNLRVLGLSMVAPCLVVLRMLPPLRHYLRAVTLAHGTYLLACDEPLSWPPSPSWAITLMPLATQAYSRLWDVTFGGLSHRLNMAITETAGGATEAGDEQPVHAGNEDEVQEALELRVELGLADDGVNILVHGGDNREEPREANRNEPEPPADDAADPEPVARAGARNNNRVGDGVRDLLGHVAVSLLLPGISAGLGELLRAALPPHWVVSPLRRPPTGVLQLRWGRSLVGGAVFILVKDLWTILFKYRQVQRMKRRKICNVPKKAESAVHTASDAPR